MSAHENDKKESYLWNRSGAPDPEVQRLESLLSGFRYEDRPLVLPVELPARPEREAPGQSALRIPPRFAAAAAILVFVGGAALYFASRPINSVSETAWTVATIEGTPHIYSDSIPSGGTSRKLEVGQTLTTNADSRAALFETDLGQIQVDPNSQLRLLESAPSQKRLQLDLGTIHAYIWAKPTEFVVNTPSAVTVDLGCAYTLRVEPDGSGTIRTTLGWVGFHRDGRDSFIPAGAMCSTHPATGPGTPCFEDATLTFRAALHDFDNAKQNDAAAAPLEIMLREARAKDALTLWHLLSRTSGAAREKVYDRLSKLVPPPPSITRDAVLQLDTHALDAYWNALDLGDISIWRYWERSSPPGRFSPGESSELRR